MGQREDIISCARSLIGYSYGTVSDGYSPEEGFTCSGMVWYAYQLAGIDIPRAQGINSYYTGSYNGWDTQCGWTINNGHWTDDANELQPGDLVFFSPVGDRERTGHVGIYSGEGNIIDSTPSRGVAERTLYVSSDFVGGGWPLEDLPDESSEPSNSAPQESETYNGLSLACIVNCLDSHVGYDKDMQVLWTPFGFEYINHPDSVRLLDEISMYYSKKPLKRVDSASNAPWIERLRQVTIAPGDETFQKIIK